MADPNTDARHGPLGFLSTKQSFERPALPLLPRVVTLKGDVWPLSARPLRARFPEGARRPPSNVPEGTYSRATWAHVNSWKGGQPASSTLLVSQDTVRAGPAAWPSTHTPVRPCPGRGHRRKGSVSASGPPFPPQEAGMGRCSVPRTPSPGRQVPRTPSGDTRLPALRWLLSTRKVKATWEPARRSGCPAHTALTPRDPPPGCGPPPGPFRTRTPWPAWRTPARGRVRATLTSSCLVLPPRPQSRRVGLLPGCAADAVVPLLCDFPGCDLSAFQPNSPVGEPGALADPAGWGTNPFSSGHTSSRGLSTRGLGAQGQALWRNLTMARPPAGPAPTCRQRVGALPVGHRVGQTVNAGNNHSGNSRIW